MQIGGTGPERQGVPPGTEGALWNDALIREAPSDGELPSVAGLGPAEISLLRGWLVQGRSTTEIGRELELSRHTIGDREGALAAQFGVRQQGDWAPVLLALMRADQITADEAADAVTLLTGREDAGPVALWAGLLREVSGSVTQPRLDELRWAVRCGALGLSGPEREVLRLTAAGVAATTIPAQMRRATDSVQRLRRGLAEKLGGIATSPGQDPGTRLVAAAARLGVLPPGHDRRTLEVAQMHVQAATLGRPMTVQQAGFVLDVLRGQTLEGSIAAYGRSSVGPLAFKLWSILDVPGAWEAGRNLPALAQQLRDLGFTDPAVTPPPSGDAPALVAARNAPPEPDPEPVRRRARVAPEAIPQVVYAGEVIPLEEIFAAPSLPRTGLDTYRNWQVQHLAQADCPGAGPSGANISYYRRQLAAELGNPDERGYLAITARAVAEGKLDAADLLQAQQFTTCRALGLNRMDVTAILAIADGLAPAQIAERLGATESNTYARLARICRTLGISGSCGDAAVRQRVLDAMQRQGMFQEPVTLPEPGTSPDAAPGAPSGASSGALAEGVEPAMASPAPLPDMPPVTFCGQALTAAEIQAAPSLSPRHREVFREWRTQGLTVSESSGVTRSVMVDRSQMTLNLGQPGPRETLAIAAKAMAEGYLSAAELASAQGLAVADALGLQPGDVRLVQGLGQGLEAEGLADAAGMTPEAMAQRMTAICAVLDVTPGDPQAVLDAAHTQGLLPERIVLPRATDGLDQYPPAVQEALLTGAAAEAGGAGRVLALAVDRGLLLTVPQAEILHDLAENRPLPAIMAAQGEGFLPAADGLAQMLGLPNGWQGRRTAQDVVDRAAAAGLMEPAPWPHPVQERDGFLSLMAERFGIDETDHALLQALKSRVGRVQAAAELAGLEPGEAGARVVAMAERLVTAPPPPGTTGRVFASLQQEAGSRGLTEASRLDEIEAAAPELTPNQAVLLMDVLQSPRAASMERDIRMQGVAERGQIGEPAAGSAVHPLWTLYTAMLEVERDLSLPAGMDEAGLLTAALLAAARARGIV